MQLRYAQTVTTSDAHRWSEGPTRAADDESPLMSPLVGRDAELALIDSLLGGGRHDGRGGSCLLLSGGPGVGKTALLDAAAVRGAAAGMRVLRASGVEFEAGIAYSALHQLLYPLRQDAERLGEHHRDALRRVFELVHVGCVGQVGKIGQLDVAVSVATAALALLAEVAAARPLLLVVDDVACFDRDSATVLGFVVRRLEHVPITFLAAGRRGSDGLLQQVIIPERVIEPLGAKAAGELLDMRSPGLAPVRRRLLAEAAGNPLAIVELPKALTDRQRSGRDSLPARLPLTQRLESVFAAPITRLPRSTRELLLLAALHDRDGAELSVLIAATRSFSGAGADDFVAAERADLVRVDTGEDGVAFRHPLIASAMVAITPPSERRAAHRALADALVEDAERRAWHLAQAAVGPDESVARALDEAALSAWRRGGGGAKRRSAGGDRRHGGASAAMRALIRAGELSPHPADRSRRLVEAAFLATITGRLDEVDRLLADAGQAPDRPTGLLFAATAHLLTSGDGDVDTACRLLARAHDDIAGEMKADGWEHQGILYVLLLVSLYTLKPEPWGLLASAMARANPDEVATFRLCFDAYVDPTHDADAIRAGIADAFTALPADAAPWQLIPLAFAAVAMDMLAEHRYLLHRMIERERDGGAIAMVVPSLMLLCHDSYVHGRWDEAELLAQDALELATAYGYQFWERQVRALLASGAAMRGDAEVARTRSEEIATWAAPRGMEVTEGYARSARSFAALGQGNYEEAFVQAAGIDAPGFPSPGVPGRWAVLNLVEAAVRTGRVAQARAHVRAAWEAGIDRIGPRTALITAGAAALAADDAHAGPLFEAALALPEAARWPWEHGRVQLAYGQWLRRTHDVASARLHLATARETFERIGALTMARRAGNELRATGVPVARADSPEGTLTAQERQIAELAADGLSNKQIGERLFLSHRTIGSHLYRIYPKLGITSRAALRGALEAMTGTAAVGRG